ncbi:MAG: glucans biosynthesis glucosyltransferase MdoH, partial [Methylobacterium sp.]
MSHSALPDRDPPAAPPLREAWHGAPRALMGRRLALAVPSLATAAAIAWLAARAYPAVDALSTAVLVTFSLVLGWQAFTAWQYLYGFLAGLFGDRTVSALERAAEAAG